MQGPKDLDALLHHHMITCTAASSSVKTSGDLLTQGELPNHGFTCLFINSYTRDPDSLLKMPCPLISHFP